MLGGVERHGYAGHEPDLPRPHAGAVDHHLGLDLALRGGDPGGAAVPGQDAGDLAILDDPDPAHAGPLGQGHGGIGRVGLPIMREEDRADDIVDVQQRPHLLGLLRRDLLRLDPEGLGHGGAPAELVPALFIGGDGDAAVLLQPGRLTGLFLELGVELQAVTGEPGQIAAVSMARTSPAACQVVPAR